MHTMTIPGELEGKFKTARLQFTVKKSSFFGSKDVFQGELAMRPLDTNNEFTKTIKFDCEGKKLSFDVTTRVREAYSGKEMT